MPIPTAVLWLGHSLSIILTILWLALPVPPGPPSTPVISNVFKDCLDLEWQPPATDGGTPVLGYHVERRSGTSRNWVFVNRTPIRDTKFHVKDLFELAEYEFRVSAENKVSTGTPSAPTQPVVAKDPWGEYKTLTLSTLHSFCRFQSPHNYSITMPDLWPEGFSLPDKSCSTYLLKSPQFKHQHTWSMHGQWFFIAWQVMLQLPQSCTEYYYYIFLFVHIQGTL